jgi:predicted membrane chloride channel (bestrophin family)
MEDGVLPNDYATRHVFIEKVCVVRGVFGAIRGNIKGSFPLAYAQFIQVLVDTVLILAPFALFCELGIWSVLAVGVLNIFFSGMNDLAKILLDPLDNSDQTFYKGSSVNMDVGVLIRESNAGSNTWKAGLEKLPF